MSEFINKDAIIDDDESIDEDAIFPFPSCHIEIEKEFLFYLDMGVRAVIDFAELSDNNICCDLS